MQRTTYFLLLPVITFTMITSPIHADTFRSDGGAIDNDDIFTDLDEWLNAVPPVTVIDFTQFPSSTLITDQYNDLGITFEPNNNLVSWIHETSSFVDGHGLSNNSGRHRIVFDEPLTIFGSLYVGPTWYEFYLEDELVAWSQAQSCFADVECFAGFILNTPFDELHVIDWGGNPGIDNLYFTFDPIPAPGALALLGLAAMLGPRRLRRSTQ